MKNISDNCILEKKNTVLHKVLVGAQGKHHTSDEILREGHEDDSWAQV